VWFLRYTRGQTDRQTDTLITVLRSPNGGELTRTDADLGILEGVLTNAVVGRRDPGYVERRRGFGEQLDAMRLLIGGRRHRVTGAVPRLPSIVR